LLPSPGFVLFVSGCTGFVQHAVANTARYLPMDVSDRINTREQACTYIPLCFAALIVQLQLQAILITAACTGFVQQVVEVRQACKVIQTDRTHPTGYIDVR
jgi:hypothetical protein